jgi:hypothetical protein
MALSISSTLFLLNVRVAGPGRDALESLLETGFDRNPGCFAGKAGENHSKARIEQPHRQPKTHAAVITLRDLNTRFGLGGVSVEMARLEALPSEPQMVIIGSLNANGVSR